MTTPVNSHLDNITVLITLAALAVPGASFSTVMLLVDEATGNPLPGGVRVETYVNATDAATDEAAGDISATTLAFIQTAFSQSPRPVEVKVGRIDTGGAETYATGYTAVKAADDAFYGVVVDRRVAADQLLVSTAVETENRVLIIQSSDADWLTTGFPAAYTPLTGRERTAVVFHDVDTTQADMAAATRWLSFDPDRISAVFEGPLKAILALATAPTAAQKTFLDTNFVNHALPYFGEPFYLDAGVNISGRPFYEILTADWFRQRLQERVATVRVNKSAKGEKIVVGGEGQALILAEIDGQFAEGTAGESPHFVPGQTRSDPVPITQADRDAGRMRFTGEAQDAVNGRLFDFDFNFSRTPISTAA